MSQTGEKSPSGVFQLLFYAWGEPKYITLMILSVTVNYVSGRLIGALPDRKKLVLFLCVAVNLLLLGYFKYFNFIIQSANSVLGWLWDAGPIAARSIALPIGISFYTFQTMSYTIDVYRRDVKTEHNIIDFGAYVVMFPQLIAGPIVKYRDVSDRLHVYKGRYELKQIEDGMTLFTFGLAKKVLLADAIGALWTDIIGVADSPSVSFVGLANASTPLVWLGVIATRSSSISTFPATP